MWRLRRESSGDAHAPASDEGGGEIRQTDRALMRLEERILTALRENESRLQATMTENSANMLSIKGDVQMLRRRCAALETAVGSSPSSPAPLSPNANTRQGHESAPVGASMAAFFSGSPPPMSPSDAGRDSPELHGGDPSKPSTSLDLTRASSSSGASGGSGGDPLATPSAAIGSGDGTGGGYRQPLPSACSSSSSRGGFASGPRGLGGGGSICTDRSMLGDGAPAAAGGRRPKAAKGRRLGQRERRESVTAQLMGGVELDPKQQAWALVEVRARAAC